MLDYTDLNKVLAALKQIQSDEEDMREQARDAKLFLYSKDGQWDPYAWEKMDGRFRGTFDMCTPVVDQIAGEIDESDFTLKVRPASGDASKDTANVLNGLIRNIRNISNFDDEVIPKSARGNVVSGFDCFEVVPDYVDADTFDQDLFLRRIPNAIDCVYFDSNSTMQDHSDANFAFKLKSYTPDAFESEFGDEVKKEGVTTTEKNSGFYHKPESILVGQMYYKKPMEIEIVKMSDGKVYKVDEDFEAVQDELMQAGITEVDRRTRDSFEVKSRLFSGSEWLTDEEDTVFNLIPLCPVYGNFDIIENKRVWFGKLEKLYDHQRVLNYAISRDIEDGALSPSTTTWMTAEMAAGHDYSKMNVDKAPIRLFNIDEQNPGLTPQQTGGPIPSQGLQTTIQNMQQMFGASSNTFNAQQGNAQPSQSGIAGLQQIEAGNTGSIKWFKSMQVAICYAGKVLVNAIPKVYDSTRQARILEEDGTTKITPLNTNVFDNQSGEVITLNDLTVGEYDAVCDFGPAFNTQQKETAQAFLDLAALDPNIIPQGKDILIKNLSTPGMDQLSDRVREQMVNDGLIPESQFTEEEQQIAQQKAQAAANQPPQPDPMMIAAEAEMQKAQAEQLNAQNKQAETQANFQVKQADLQLQQQQLQLKQKELELDAAKFEREGQAKYNETLIKADQEQQKIDLNKESQEFTQQFQVMQQMHKELSQSISDLKTLREAMGVDSVVSPNGVKVYQEQTEIVEENQEDIK